MSFLDDLQDLMQFCALFSEVCTRVALMAQSAALFRALDTDGSGFLEREELHAVTDAVLASFSCAGFSGEEIAQLRTRLHAQLESVGGGVMDLYDFSLLLEQASTRIRLMSRARLAFNKLDSDRRGFLEREQLEVLAERLLRQYHYHGDGLLVSDEDRTRMADRMLRLYDADNEGRMDLFKFSSLFESITEEMNLLARARTKVGGCFEINATGTMLSLLVT